MSDSRFWMSKADVLKLCGVSDETFRTTIRPLLAAEHSRRETSRGNPLRFFAPAVVAILVQRAAAADIDDAMLAGDSPALERYRLARAKLAELDYSAKCGQLVPVADFVNLLGPLSAILRAAGDTLGVKYGPDAQTILNEALDEFGRQAGERLLPLVPAATTEDNSDDSDKQA